MNPTEELSTAGEDFGRAFCLEPDRQSLPLDQLSPQEQQCVRRVGLDFERRVQERMGFTPVDGGVGFPIQTSSGSRIATLSMDAAGNVTVCVPGDAQRRCVLVGQGPAAAVAAEEVLTLLGFNVGQTPVNP